MIVGGPIASGNTADVYRSGEDIIKVFKDFLPDTEAEKEARKQRTAYSLLRNVPEVKEVTRTDGRQMIRMAYVEGKTLGEDFLSNPDKIEDLLLLSVKEQVRVQSYSVEGIEHMKVKLARQIGEANGIEETCRKNLLDKLSNMPMGNQLCHGDFHLFNVIQTEKGCMIIDWVDATAGSPKADACRSYLLYLSYDRQIAQKYLDLYCSKSGVEKASVLEWLPILAAARLTESVPDKDREQLRSIVSESISP
ncbi:phosphotransferase family protein [Alkalibacterium pelagium]|uniref:Phosphotransferase enzyme family protein n=1 Tax=Alkalibacterium pelagium TaxID=426702 RepID=A0A1H7M1E3_9LACT|nr:aminoglycoside phosphotransferase family protein [Alkalibacterium pelagium]GEN51028.1 aminoglycoside phosphotransferase [Alkalibacterium pelagium]SEL05090.1 Phosphotransferase enzyme family protein [Alkalibacterium pelagium]